MKLTFYDIWRTIRHPIEVLKEELVSRKLAESRIRSLDHTIFYHLIKCLITVNNGLFTHWSKEINSYFLQLVVNLKPSGRRPKSSLYYELLYTEPFTGVKETIIEDVVVAYVNMMKNDYGTAVSHQFDFNRLYAVIPEFYKIFSIQLSMATVDASFIKPLLEKLRMQVVGDLCELM